VYADNVLEHLDSIIKPLEEIWRICKNKSKVTILVPLAPSYWSFLDPTHKQFFTFNTFDYFTKEHVLNYYSKARFKIVYRKIRFHPVLKLFEPIFNIHERVQKFYSIFLAGIIPPFMLKIILEVEK
jgi:ubiquinone/menaquinone biosynthesis C-methylase UbiE